MPENSRCPVCGRPVRPAGPGAACGECGWILIVPLQAGRVTADLRHDFDDRLRRAQRAQADRDELALEAALRDVIADLTPAMTSALVEVGADQVAVTTADLDGAGSPRVREAGSVAWTTLLPGLAGAEPQRHAQLAGGTNGMNAAAVGRILRDGMPPLPDGQLLVVCRPAGWDVLEAAAEALAARPRARLLRLAGPGTSLARARLAELAAKAPLRHPYRLMTAAINRQTGAVAIRPRQLFAAGAGPGTEATLSLRRLPGEVTDTTLAIFADTGAARGGCGAVTDPLAMYSVSLPSGSPARLRAVLDGPGQVRIAEPPGAVRHPGTWAQVRGQLPATVTTVTAPVDLVCAVELAGPRDVVRRRVRLVRDLAELLGAEYPDQRRLRVAMVTCTDHVFASRRGGEYDEVTGACELGPADAAAAWLASRPGAAARNQSCAPVEDMLAESHRLLAGCRGAGRVPRLLTVAGRRPHPYPQPGDDRMICPRHVDWRFVMDQLTRETGARCVVIADVLSAGPERADWRRLGPAGQGELSSASAQQVAEDLGLLAARDQRISLPLVDEPEGALR